MKKVFLSVTLLLLLSGCRQILEKEVKGDIIVIRHESKMCFVNKEFDSITISGRDYRGYSMRRFNTTYAADSTCLETEYLDQSYNVSIDTIKAIRNDTVYNYLYHKYGMFHDGDSAFYAASYLTQDQKIEEERWYRNRNIITLSIVLILLIIVAYIKARNTEIKRLEKIERLKKLYESIKIPLIMGGERISSSQHQTRQLATGALLYSLPKEHTLSFSIRNISPKMITAIEVKLVYFNAFGDVLSSVLLSSNCTLQPYDLEHVEKYVDRPSNVVSFDVVITRVRFLDGTIWTNEE